MVEVIKKHWPCILLSSLMAGGMYLIYNSNFVIVAWDREAPSPVKITVPEEG